VATAATDDFHRAVSDARYADICRVSRYGAFRGVTELRCEDFLAYMRGRLGAFLDAAAAGPPQVEIDASSPYVSLEFTTRYEQGNARETFSWRIGETPNQAALLHYRVEAEALSR
jgi:hypothetical protein